MLQALATRGPGPQYIAAAKGRAPDLGERGRSTLKRVQMMVYIGVLSWLIQV